MSARQRKLKVILQTLLDACEVESSAVVSNKGRIMAAALGKDVDEKAVSSMAAAMLSIGERVGSVLGTGRTQSLSIDCSQGLVLLRALPDNVLIATAPADAKVGLIDHELTLAIHEISQIL
jgi:predicted regulator of Ras-like GTPase activity (Roadblock/LC7/MglB family)